MDKLQKIVENVKSDLLVKKNVLGVAIGEKWVKGVNTGAEAIIVLVEKKEAASNLDPKDVIPSMIEGVTTDVVGKCGNVEALADTIRYRPVPGGVSAGHVSKATGTIGGWFLDKDKDLVALSNYHVFVANGKVGDLTFQPGLYDKAANVINEGFASPYTQYPYFATLKSYAPLNRYGNLQDSAIAKVGHPALASTTIKDLGNPIGFKDSLTVGTIVTKKGRTSNVTTGRVIGIHATVAVDYGGGFRAIFNDQIITTNMSAPGDSGSLLLDSSKYIVGLLFAGSSTVTIHNYIRYPRDLYGLTIPGPTIPVPVPRPPPTKVVAKKQTKINRRQTRSRGGR